MHLHVRIHVTYYYVMLYMNRKIMYYFNISTTYGKLILDPSPLYIRVGK